MLEEQIKSLQEQVQTLQEQHELQLQVATEALAEEQRLEEEVRARDIAGEEAVRRINELKEQLKERDAFIAELLEAAGKELPPRKLIP